MKNLFFLGLFLFASSLLAQNQPFDLLKPYHNVKFYELENDKNLGDVIFTKCGEPTDYLKIIVDNNGKSARFTFDNEIFHLISITKGDHKEEFVLWYKDDMGQDATAIFFYDRKINTLLFQFEGKEYAFVAKEDLKNFKVIDKC